MNGGDGNDNLWAMARRDVTKARRAGRHGQRRKGNDRIHVRDGEADTVTCGAGYDVVWADRKDIVAPIARW